LNIVMRVRGVEEEGGFISVVILVVVVVVVRMAQTEKSARAGRAAQRRVVADIFIAVQFGSPEVEVRVRRGDAEMRRDAMQDDENLRRYPREKTGRSERPLQERKTMMNEQWIDPSMRTRRGRGGGGCKGILFHFLSSATVTPADADAVAHSGRAPKLSIV